MRGRESNADRQAYETHGVSRHPHRAARVGIEPTKAWVRATLACQQTAAHRSPERPSCPTRTRTWDPRLNKALLCQLSYRASCSCLGAGGAARNRTSPCRASTGRAACNASAPCQRFGRPGGTRTRDSVLPKQVGWPLPYNPLRTRPRTRTGMPEGHGVLSAARLPDSARRACLI